MLIAIVGFSFSSEHYIFSIYFYAYKGLELNSMHLILLDKKFSYWVVQNRN